MRAPDRLFFRFGDVLHGHIEQQIKYGEEITLDAPPDHFSINR